jgi:ABC-type multidrug transport system ATPase subunit
MKRTFRKTIVRSLTFTDSDPIDIIFKNITYKIKTNIKKEKSANKNPEYKVILNNISGICKHGELTAILGASGAGKTTLLNILCSRIDREKNSKS